MFCLTKLSAASLAIMAAGALAVSCGPKPTKVSPEAAMSDRGPALAFATNDAALQ